VHRIGRTGRMGRQGTAISLFSIANKPVARDMVTLLQEANQVVPDWLLKFASEGGAGGRGYQRQGKFGGRDFRQNAQVRQYRHNGASFPGQTGMPMGGQNDRMGGGGYMQQGYMANIAHKQGGGMYGGNMGMGGGGMAPDGQGGWMAGNWGGGMGLPDGGYPGGQGGISPGRSGQGGQGGGGWMGMPAPGSYYPQFGQGGGPGGGDGQNGSMMMGGMMWPHGAGMPQGPPGADGSQYGAPQSGYAGAQPIPQLQMP